MHLSFIAKLQYHQVTLSNPHLFSSWSLCNSITFFLLNAVCHRKTSRLAKFVFHFMTYFSSMSLKVTHVAALINFHRNFPALFCGFHRHIVTDTGSTFQFHHRFLNGLMKLWKMAFFVKFITIHFIVCSMLSLRCRLISNPKNISLVIDQK